MVNIEGNHEEVKIAIFRDRYPRKYERPLRSLYVTDKNGEILAKIWINPASAFHDLPRIYVETLTGRVEVEVGKMNGLGRLDLVDSGEVWNEETKAKNHLEARLHELISRVFKSPSDEVAFRMVYGWDRDEINAYLRRHGREEMHLANKTKEEILGFLHELLEEVSK